jgi:hypothetical protein
MFPVSGAEQLKSGPIGKRPVTSHKGGYSRLVSGLGYWHAPTSGGVGCQGAIGTRPPASVAFR